MVFQVIWIESKVLPLGLTASDWRFSKVMFITPESSHSAEIVMKKSRFIGHLVPVKTAEEAEGALAELRVVHKSATHNCYAYTVGLTVPVERFSDDGEPSGTAGRPILEVLRRKPIANALVVVTRYFGGTLLGANGLVRAYAEATATVIDEASLLHCQRMQRLQIRVDYGRFGKLEYELSQLGYTLLDKEFSADVAFSLWVTVEEQAKLMEAVLNWTNGQAQVEVAAPEYVGIRQDSTFVHGVWPFSNDAARD